ncbi:MAG TPA: BON domain-containing protein [Albitalea sp.]
MKPLGLMTTLAAALALGACDSRDGTTAGQKVDETVASARTAAAQAKQSAQQGLNEAARATQEKSEVVAQKVGDAALTAAIKAGLAKDPELSALRINVDTKDGHVSLYGSAPSDAARQRAQAIALAENGVTGVDNQLAIETR